MLYAFLLLNLVRTALWLLPYGSLKQQVERIMPVWICAEKSRQSISADFIAWVVRVAGDYSPGGAKCLARAITAQLLLNRYSYSHELYIGVAKDAAQKIEAHAWVEYQGRVIVGGLNDLDRFTPLSKQHLSEKTLAAGVRQ
ncbi:MAG: lasso peptide biosynthesis B2 protein [Phormidesmis sp.]